MTMLDLIVIVIAVLFNIAVGVLIGFYFGKRCVDTEFYVENALLRQKLSENKN